MAAVSEPQCGSVIAMLAHFGFPSRYRARNRSFCSDRKSTRLNSSHSQISYAVFCLKKKRKLAGKVMAHLTVVIGKYSGTLRKLFLRPGMQTLSKFAQDCIFSELYVTQYDHHV